MQKTVGLARAGSGRSQRNNFGYHLSNLNYDGKIAGLYDLEETLGKTLKIHIAFRLILFIQFHYKFIAFCFFLRALQAVVISPSSNLHGTSSLARKWPSKWLTRQNWMKSHVLISSKRCAAWNWFNIQTLSDSTKWLTLKRSSISSSNWAMEAICTTTLCDTRMVCGLQLSCKSLDFQHICWIIFFIVFFFVVFF